MNERNHRVSALSATARPPAGARAMLREPRLVSFSGSCAPAPPARTLTCERDEQGIREEEPALGMPTPGELRLDEAHASPTSREDFAAGIVAGAAETMAMLAEHRFTRPLALRRSREERILKLADAIFATGDRAIGDLLGWWESARDDGSSWAIWPPVFMLGLIDGAEGLIAIERVLGDLRAEESCTVLIAANALAAVPHPGVGALAEDLLDSANPIASAIGLEMLSRHGLLDVERIARHLDASAPEVIAAAVRALVRSEAEPPIAHVLPLLTHADSEVAWEAARAVTIWCAPDALNALRDGHTLGATLRARAVELFVMAGEAADIAHVEAIVARSTMTSELLDAIGRFGHPLAWSFLLHFLADPELAESAEGALHTLFGPMVSLDDRRRPSAWRETLMDRDLDPTLRYRLGEPWTPEVVARECVIDSSRPQQAVELRLDEIAVRTGVRVNIDLAKWAPDAGAALLVTTESALRTTWKPGTWNDARARANNGRTR